LITSRAFVNWRRTMIRSIGASWTMSVPCPRGIFGYGYASHNQSPKRLPISIPARFWHRYSTINVALAQMTRRRQGIGTSQALGLLPFGPNAGKLRSSPRRVSRLAVDFPHHARAGFWIDKTVSALPVSASQDGVRRVERHARFIFKSPTSHRGACLGAVGGQCCLTEAPPIATLLLTCRGALRVAIPEP